MGILGLTTFISKHANKLYENYSLHDCNLVIDGNSLLVQLYLISKCNSAFGGEYDKYADFVRLFFNNLKKCNITPFVLFDGGYEDKKLKTALKRLRSRISDASRLNPANSHSLLVFPILLKETFLEVLHEMSVTLTMCEYEADNEIAVVARHLNCPVLSYDSDFFIYNVLYIPFPTLNLKPTSTKHQDTVAYSLKCKIYKVENFLKRFSGITADMLPLMATLLGNDYVKRGVFSKFYHNIKIQKCKKRNLGQCKISAIIDWLKNETYESALNTIYSRFKSHQQPRIRRLIEMSCSNYTTTVCVSLKELGIITGDVEDTTKVIDVEDAISEVSGTDSNCDDSGSELDLKEASNDSESVYEYQNVDDKQNNNILWVKNILKCGKISSKFYDLIHKSMYMGSPQVEDYTKPDAFLQAMPILRFSFDIVTGFSNQDMIYHGRHYANLKTKIIKQDETSQELLNLWQDKSQQPNKELFFIFLQKTLSEDDLSFIKDLPQSMKMFVLSLQWLMKSSTNTSKPDECHIYSLLLCFIMISLVIPKIGTFKGDFNSKYCEELTKWRKECMDTSGDADNREQDSNDKVQYKDCMTAASSLLKFFKADEKTLTNPKNFKTQGLHFFAQYQSCMQQFSYLNTLTSEYFTPVKFCKFYNGVFTYSMYKNLKSHHNPVKHVAILLNYSPSVSRLFLTLSSFLGFPCYPIPPRVQGVVIKSGNNQPRRKTMVPQAEPIENCEEEVVSDECDLNNRFSILKCVNY